MSGKVQHRILGKKVLSDLEGECIAILEQCKGRGEFTFFVRHLLTKSERIMLGRRIRIAKRLLAGKTYDFIRSEMKVGLATIVSVDSWLSDAMPDYRQIVQSDTRGDSLSTERSAFERLRKKYPLHFLLINALLDAKKK